MIAPYIKDGVVVNYEDGILGNRTRLRGYEPLGHHGGAVSFFSLPAVSWGVSVGGLDSFGLLS